MNKLGFWDSFNYILGLLIAALIVSSFIGGLLYAFFDIPKISVIIIIFGAAPIIAFCFYKMLSSSKKSYNKEKKTSIHKDYIRRYKLFSIIAPDKRNQSIEAIVNESINNHKELWSYNNNAADCCISESKNVYELERPAYLAAASYCFLYQENDLKKSTQYAFACLREIQCYRKEDIVVDVYRWFITEERLSSQLFDEHGYTTFADNPYKS